VIDLSSRVGMPIALDPESGKLEFGDGVAVEGTGERRFADLRDVLADPDALDDERAEQPGYLLYRGVHCPSDARLLADHGVRYDLTVTLPGEVGGELVKTAGHIHNAAPDGVGHPEIYDVIHGHAAFILQEDEPLRVSIITCGPGERILIPPGASHLTVNIGRQPLVVADLVAIASQNDYGEFRTRRGAAVHLFRDGDAWSERINRAYSTTPVWRVLNGTRIGDFAPGDAPIYTDAIANPGDYHYLTAPAPREAEMQALWSSRDR
jgi:glucose-6-phosphate isomerase, archaeal